MVTWPVLVGYITTMSCRVFPKQTGEHGETKKPARWRRLPSQLLVRPCTTILSRSVSVTLMAAAAAACRRVLLQSGQGFRLGADVDALLRGLGSNHGGAVHLRRYVSQLRPKTNGKPAFLVDTLALVRRLEAQGIPSKQAEAITSAITEVLNDSLENVAQSFVSQGEIQKEYHFSMLQRETEKLKTDIDKMRSELRYEIDKVTAGQRLDLNLERGRTRDELAKQSAETSDLTNKLDREIHALRAQLEAAKYDVIKYCIGTLVSISAVGLAVIRILM